MLKVCVYKSIGFTSTHFKTEKIAINCNFNSISKLRKLQLIAISIVFQNWELHLQLQLKIRMEIAIPVEHS